METKIIEARHTTRSLWGKFLVGKFDNEWSRCPRSAEKGLDPLPVLSAMGWDHQHFLVMDLSLGHGALFHLRDLGLADIETRRVYFGPLFEDFLAWLCVQDMSDLKALPDELELEGSRMRTLSRVRGTQTPG